MKPLLALVCVLSACVYTQRVTLVAKNDPDADACFTACKGSETCARACPGVTVEDGDCQRSQRACVSGSEVSGVATTATVVGLATLAVVGLMSLTLAAFTPNL